MCLIYNLHLPESYVFLQPRLLQYQSTMAATRGRGRGGSRGGSRGRTDNGRPRCTHCGQTDHQVDRCWDMIGRPSTAHVTTESTSSTSTNEEQTITISQADYD